MCGYQNLKSVCFGRLDLCWRSITCYIEGDSFLFSQLESGEKNPMDSDVSLPAGTVTFLFTDIEGSTRLWEQHPEAMRDALARHDEILRDAVESHGGHLVKEL